MRGPPFAILTGLLLATAVLAFTPSASAAIICDFSGPSGGGIVGQTLDYVNAEANDNCNNTVYYAWELCVDVLGPNACAIA